MKYGCSTKSRTATIKGKLFFDIILIWSVNCTKSDKKIGHISQKKPNVLKFPKMYNFCIGQKNQAEVKLQIFPAVLNKLRLGYRTVIQSWKYFE